MPTIAVFLRHTYYLLPASHREGVNVLLSGFALCPGLFYDTPAQDGILSRIRVPGGILDSKQCHAIADIAENYGGGYVDITNRANLQIRELRSGINAAVLQDLQNIGIGSRNFAVDHIRNIMTSPTAGIDPQELIDTRPFVQDWENYIAAHPTLSGLSAKFSVCFDGGGTVSVCDRLNDIMFAAVLIDGRVYFRLHLSVGVKGKPPIDMGIVLLPESCLPVLAALAEVYLNYTDPNSRRKLRLRELLNNLGCERYLQEVEQRLGFQLTSQGQFDKTSVENRSNSNYQHIGIHPQRQPGLFYIGVVLPLGRLETQQIRGLADLAQRFGNGTLRLTPWQNLLLTDIPARSLTDVKSEIAVLKLDVSASNINSALVACSGNKGCAASATDTKGDALALAKYLETHVSLNHPVHIHFSGCEKSCAQHSHSDITLLGVSLESENGTMGAYHIYVGDSLRGEAIGDSNQKFGRQLYQYVTVAELPVLLGQMLQVYKIQCRNPDESFGEFVNRYEIAQLHPLFSSVS
ncbi:precorrin-3B synthase [Nodularia sp. LEGE 04288]|uniref:precorrin-3B synthase n=1 Tax=unclassified Nodularia (in: cyanobacteria) TaxID=2656917 RepID=UPI0023DFCE4B|nr:precorrin-3B synthase [Nodularia sp. LEGE 04288]MCC2693858.1 precorrin-3B synthase [Nodularia sp. LEGE 04288]